MKERGHVVGSRDEQDVLALSMPLRRRGYFRFREIVHYCFAPELFVYRALKKRTTQQKHVNRLIGHGIGPMHDAVLEQNDGNPFGAFLQQQRAFVPGIADDDHLRQDRLTPSVQGTIVEQGKRQSACKEVVPPLTVQEDPPQRIFLGGKWHLGEGPRNSAADGTHLRRRRNIGDSRPGIQPVRLASDLAQSLSARARILH